MRPCNALLLGKRFWGKERLLLLPGERRAVRESLGVLAVQDTAGKPISLQQHLEY